MKKLKDLRSAKKVSQQKVADYLGVTQQAYANYESGFREPDLMTLCKLSKYFEVSIDYLLENNFNPFNDDLVNQKENKTFSNLQVDYIIELIKQKGLNLSSVEKSLGFGNGAIKRWKESSPSINKLYCLSDFLNISIIELLNEKKNDCFLKPQNSKEELLIKNFRFLLSEQQDIITAQMAPFIEMNKKGEINELLNSISKENA